MDRAFQPGYNSDKSKLIVMVGEIYNSKPEQAMLTKISGHPSPGLFTQAEFCLYIFESLGIEGFVDLNGSFLVIVYDITKNSLTIITDRFASIPIYYTVGRDGKFCFSTRAYGPAKVCDEIHNLNHEAIFEFFTFQKLLGTKTFYKNISMVPPATMLSFEQNRISLKNYWHIQYKEKEGSSNDYAELLSHNIKTVVNDGLSDTLKNGILLSGGLDSRMLLAASDKPLVCLTFGDWANREVLTARKIAEIKGYPHIFLRRDFNHYVNLINEAVKIGDGMYSFVHAHSIGFIERIKQECDLVFHGLALERYFRGTYFPKSFHLNNHLRRDAQENILSENNLIEKFLVETKNSLYRRYPENIFSDNIRKLYQPMIHSSAEIIMKESNQYCENIFDRFIYPDICYHARSKAFVFETSLAVYLKHRNIMYDNRLIDLHLKMPLKHRINSHVWMEAMKRLHPAIAKLKMPKPLALFYTLLIQKNISVFAIIRDRITYLIKIIPFILMILPNPIELIKSNPKMIL
jgi:asparagine synthase (glutamine-hydrolysing)